MTPGGVVIALGANLGDAIGQLRQAFDQLDALAAEPVRRSSLWETSPVDCPPGSPKFTNAVALFTPRFGETPESLLAQLQAAEKELGRRPKLVLNEARPLDLDLIAWAGETRATPALTLPHPRAHQREFVLRPLAELAPELVLPGQVESVAALLAKLSPDPQFRRVA